jgi:hypothetical protein
MFAMKNDTIEFSYGSYFNGYKTTRYSKGAVTFSETLRPRDEKTENIP